MTSAPLIKHEADRPTDGSLFWCEHTPRLHMIHRYRRGMFVTLGYVERLPLRDPEKPYRAVAYPPENTEVYRDPDMEKFANRRDAEAWVCALIRLE